MNEPFTKPKRLSKRRTLVWAGLLLIIGLVLAWMTPVLYYTIIGYLKGEAFYSGRPTGYWVHALNKNADADYGPSGPYGAPGKSLRDGGPEAVPILLEMLDNENPGARNRALITLNLMISQKKIALPELVQPVQQLMTTETDMTNLRLAMDVITALDRPARAKVATEVLHKNTHLSARFWSLATLTGLASENHRAVDPIRQALQDREPQIRARAAASLRQLGSLADSAIPQLKLCLADPDPDVRLTAAESIWALKRESGPILPILTETIKAVDRDMPIEVRELGMVWIQERPMRLRAVSVLAEMGPAAVKALPQLLEALKDKDILIQRGAATALGRIGPPAKDAVPALLNCLQNRQAGIHLYAARALALISPDCRPAVDALIEDLRDPESLTHIPAAAVLGDIGPAARAAVPELKKRLNENTLLRVLAARALWRIGYEKGLVVQALLEAVRDGDNSTRSQALLTLGTMRQDARDALPVLVSLWVEGDDRLFRCRLAALATAPPPASIFFPPVMRTLAFGRTRQYGSIREPLGRALKQIDPEAAKKVGVP